MSRRYRCAGCGNRTRFDVLATRRSRAFHHFDLGGELTIEEEEILSEVIESVTCRWCSSSSAIEELAADDLAVEHGAVAQGAPTGGSAGGPAR